MSVFHDEVEIEDMEYDEETETYYYPCPCGDKFEITKEELEAGEDVARCPSCSLLVKVIYDPEDFMAGERVSAPTKTDLAIVTSKMDIHNSNVSSNDETTVVSDSGSTSVILSSANLSQLSCVVGTGVNSTSVTTLVQTGNPAPGSPRGHSAVDGPHDRDGSECEQQGLTRKRSQNNSDASQCEKRNASTEGTPKRVRSSSKGNGATPNRRPRSKSESGASSDGFDSFSVEDTLRHLSGSVTPDSADASFKNAPVSSMLEDVLTEKKLTLLRSPEVIQFLQKQQAQKVKENRISLE